jgi:hypothetical protein
VREKESSEMANEWTFSSAQENPVDCGCRTPSRHSAQLPTEQFQLEEFFVSHFSLFILSRFFCFFTFFRFVNRPDIDKKIRRVIF